MSNKKYENPFVVHTFGLEKEPYQANCPSCGKTTMTEVEKEKTTCWHLIAPMLWTIISCCCCCFEKYCKNLENPTDINHYCGHCGCFLGRYYKTIEAKRIEEV